MTSPASSSTATSPPVPKTPAIGIDLGTTYCCMAVCQDDEVSIIKNMGKPLTPSYIAFVDPTSGAEGSQPHIIFGEAAKTQDNIDPEKAIYDVKRLIGRPFSDPLVQTDMKRWPFKVVDEEGTPRIAVNGKLYHPEQMSAMLLKHLKEQAEIRLGGPVTDVVITVPAYFKDGQRQATIDAGRIAGLNVLRIINEPTAAAIAYNHQQQLIQKSARDGTGTDLLKKKNILIFDLGGGTFDLTLLTMEGSKVIFEVVDGDAHLGGQDCDNSLVDYCIQEFKKEHKIDLSKPPRNNEAEDGNDHTDKDVNDRLRQIKNECEKQKINLSAKETVSICVECIYEELDLEVKISRSKFESLNQHLFDRSMKIVDRVLKKGRMATDAIDQVMLVGGSTRIPKIKEMLTNYFGSTPCQNIRQDEAVAYGAAVVANQIRSDRSGGTLNNATPTFTTVQFIDVVAHSIGIEVYVKDKAEGTSDFYTIIKQNTKLPCREIGKVLTVFDNQVSAEIKIYEGNNEKVAENELLGKFKLNNLPPNSPKGQLIEVNMDVNEEGILSVTAQCPANKAKNNITVKASKGRLDPAELLRLQFDELFVSSQSSTIRYTGEWGTS